MLINSVSRLLLIILAVILFGETYCEDAIEINTCDDEYGCPINYEAICAYNTTCYRSYKTKCDLEETNSNLPEGQEEFVIVNDESNCNSDISYTPLCEQCSETCSTIPEAGQVCTYSCKGKCNKTFLNNCSLEYFNCDRPEDYHQYILDGSCELEDCPDPA